MKRKILSAFAVLCVLIFASCADFDTAEQQDKHTDGSSACITISLSEASRTAFPTIDKQGENWSTSGTKCYPFDSITLKGTPVTENAVAAVPVEKTWETEKVGLKYTYAVTKMEGASINVTAGATYMFTLTARHGNNSWQGTVGKTIMSGTNSLSFTLELNSLSSESTESYGELFVELTVPETVKAADAYLKNLDESQIIMQGENVYSSASAQYPTMVTFSNRLVPAGSYVVVFTLWGDEGKTLKLGEWREYAQVSSGETSESHPVIKDLSSIHTVTFRSMITQNRNYYGGGYNSTPIKEVSVLYGDTVERPQDPEPDSRPSSDDNSENIYFNRDDDFFSGWYVSEDGGNTICDTAFDFSTPITSDTVLVANFETVEYSYATSAYGEFTQFKFNDEGECALTAGEKIYLKARSSSESTVVKYKLDNGEYKDINPTEAIPLSLGSHDICIKLAEAETEYKLKISASYNQVTGLDASAYLGGLDIKWNSYGGDSRVEAAGENGGYFIFVAKSLYDYTTTPLVSADEIRTDSDYIENDMGSKGYFCKKLTTQILNSGYAVILNPPPKTDCVLILFAYAGTREDDPTKLDIKEIGRLKAKTKASRYGKLNIYGHYIYDKKDYDSIYDPNYMWYFGSMTSEKVITQQWEYLKAEKSYFKTTKCCLGFEAFNMTDAVDTRIRGSWRHFVGVEMDDDEENTYCFGEAKVHESEDDGVTNWPRKFSSCTKKVTTLVDRTQPFVFEQKWKAYEIDDYGDPTNFAFGDCDDYLGEVKATFTYTPATDTWTCEWSSTCGASGSSTIRAGERTGKDNGGKDDGLHWELHNTNDGEIEFHWDWGWDEEQ